MHKLGKVALSCCQKGRPSTRSDQSRAADAAARVLQQLNHKISEKSEGALRLTISQRADIICLHNTADGKNSKTTKQLALMFAVSEHSIHKICSKKGKARVEQATQGNVDLEKVKCFMEEIQPEVSKLLLEWHKVQRQCFCNVKKFQTVMNQVGMMTTAMNIAKDLGLNWKPSTWWFYSWASLY